MLTIRTMQPVDIHAGDRLRALANWNQTAEDWARILRWEPDGCFVAEQAGQIVGTVTSTVFGRDLAWIGMMLVDPDLHRQGIGRRLLSHVLEWLEHTRQVRCIGLDATPIGKTLYDTMGFTEAYTLQRWEGVGPRLEATGNMRPLRVEDVPRLADLDRCALGVDRLRVIRDVVAAHPAGCAAVEREGAIVGYACSRPGARRWYVGPAVVREADVAQMLLAGGLAPLEGRLLVMDIPDSNHTALAFAESAGWQPVRPFIRMWRGEPPVQSDPHTCMAIVGPEVG